MIAGGCASLPTPTDRTDSSQADRSSRVIYAEHGANMIVLHQAATNASVLLRRIGPGSCSIVAYGSPSRLAARSRWP
jgi:hypothetical protein